MWSREGIECVIDLTAWEKEHELWEKKKIWDILKEEPMHDIEPKLPLQMMILRARMNSHRFYEIYTFSTETEVTKTDIEEYFESSPQDIVNFIRDHGVQIYSDRENTNRQVII